MKRILLIFAILFLALITTGLKSNQNESTDDTYRKKIIGSWSEGDSPYSIATFEAGGRYHGNMWESPAKKKLLLTLEGKWWIENGRLYNTLSKATPPLIPVTDKPVIDIIISISETQMILIDEDGLKYEKLRVN